MKKYILILTALMTSFLSTGFAHNIKPVGEVIVERGTNCYTAMLNTVKGFKSTNVAYFAIAVAALTTAINLDISTMFEAVGVMAAAPFAWINKEGEFTRLKADEAVKLDEADTLKYQDDLAADILKRDEDTAKQIVELQKNGEDSEAVKEEIAELKRKLDGIKVEDIQEMMKTLRLHGKALAKQQDEGTINGSTLETALKIAFDAKESELKGFNTNKGSVEIVVKATQTYGDITDGEDFAQMKPGILDIPVRMPKIRQLFTSLPLRTEFLEYAEQDTVVRDAKNVAKCAPAVTDTKETVVVNQITTKVVKDQIDFCRLFVADYPFMRSRIDRLINQSLSLKIDSQYLLGDGTGNNIAGIDSYSSEFNAANAACDISTSIQDASYVDLVLGMDTQIVELGQQNSYMPNIVLVNKCDWFIFVQSRKDLNNNYLDARVTMSGGVPTIGGMQVIWTPIVPQNELYVMDTTRGESIDRQELILEVAFENGTNWESNIASLQGYERLNLLVENNNANAFMKCTDVAAAITAITEV